MDFIFIKNFCVGLIVGAFVVGSSVNRTISVAEGKSFYTFINCVINSIAYYYSVIFITRNNTASYIGTCVGSCFYCVWLASRKKSLTDTKKGLL